MEPLCPVDGLKLSRFLDAELGSAEMEEMTAHLKACPLCELRLSQFKVADGLLAKVRTSGARSGRIAVSVSVAAALVVTVAANLLLTRVDRPGSQAPLTLSAAPSDTLASFYERVATPPPASAGSGAQGPK